MRLFKPNVDKMLEQKNINGLLKAMDDKELEIADAALEALGQIGGENVARALIKKINWGNLDQRIFFRIHNPGLERATFKVSRVLGDIGSLVIIPDLLALLNNPDWTIRQASAEALGELKSTEAIPFLIEGIQDETMQEKCIWALGKIGDDKAIPVLHNHLNDESGARSITIHALTELNDQSITHKMKKLIFDPKVSSEAAKALAKFEGKKAIPDLKKALENSMSFKKYSMVSAANGILEAIAEIGDPSIIPFLMEFQRPLKPRYAGNVKYIKKYKDEISRKVDEVVWSLKNLQ